MNPGEEGSQEQAHYFVQREEPATLGKRNFPSITNNPTQFPLDCHNDFQHNEELGPVPPSDCPITVGLPVRLSILQTPPQGKEEITSQRSVGGEGEKRQRKETGIAHSWTLSPLDHSLEMEVSILKGLCWVACSLIEQLRSRLGFYCFHSGLTLSPKLAPVTRELGVYTLVGSLSPLPGTWAGPVTHFYQ